MVCTAFGIVVFLTRSNEFPRNFSNSHINLQDFNNFMLMAARVTKN